MKLLILLTIFIYCTACSDRAKTDKRHQLAGMYQLFISENQDSSGAWHEDPWTKGGTGYIVYDGLGHMAVQITRRGYKDFDWLSENESIMPERVKGKTDSMSADELRAAVTEFSGSYVYIANYTIEDTADVVAHHRISASIPAIWGTTVRRAFSFNGDTLILRILNGNRRLKWIKQK